MVAQWALRASFSTGYFGSVPILLRHLLGFMLCYGLLFLVVAYILFNIRTMWQERVRTWHPYVGYSAIIIVSGLLLLPLMQPYLEISGTTGMRKFEEIISTIPRPGSYFFKHPGALSWRSLSEHSAYAFDDWWSHFHFMGSIPWLAILLIPVVLWKDREHAQSRNIAIGVFQFLSILFCLRFGDFTLYKLIFKLPGFDSMRAMDRIMHVQAFYFALIMVLVFAQFGKKEWSRILFGLSIPLLIVLENKLDITKLRSFNKYDAQGMVDRIVLDMELQRDSTTKALAYMPARCVMPYEEDHMRSIVLHLNSMLAGQQLGIPVVNAYTGGYPGNYMQFWVALNENTLNDWCRYNGIDMDGVTMVNNIRRPILHEDTVYLQGLNDRYVGMDTNKNDLAIMDRTEMGLWETFVRIRVTPDHYAFLAHNGNFLSAALYIDSSLVAINDELGDRHIEQKSNGQHLCVDRG